MIVWVDVVLNRTVAVTVNDVSTTYAVVIIRVGKVSSSVDGFKLWFLTWLVPMFLSLSRDVFGRLSVKPWCCWLWRLVMSLVRFDPTVYCRTELDSRWFILRLHVGWTRSSEWNVLKTPANHYCVDKWKLRFSNTMTSSFNARDAFVFPSFERFREDGRKQIECTTGGRIKKTPFLKLSGYVWTRPILRRFDSYNFAFWEGTTAFSCNHGG